MSDPVNHPQHYAGNGVEVIDVIETLGLGFHLGNAVKYIARANHKGAAIQDLEKAEWYLKRTIVKRVPTWADNRCCMLPTPDRPTMVDALDTWKLSPNLSSALMSIGLACSLGETETAWAHIANAQAFVRTEIRARMEQAKRG